jgi:hypothetical protein
MSGAIIDLKELFKKHNSVEEVLNYLWDMFIEHDWIELRWDKKRMDIIEDFKIMEFAEEFIIDWFYEFKEKQNKEVVL